MKVENYLRYFIYYLYFELFVGFVVYMCFVLNGYIFGLVFILILLIIDIGILDLFLYLGI